MSNINPFCVTQTMGARERQEDSYGIVYDAALSSNGLPTFFILADGMGGYEGGSIASQIVIDSIKAQVSGLGTIEPETFLTLIETANKDISRFLKLNPESRGLGTTVVLVLIKEGRIFWASVGDSALYLVDRAHNLTRLNEDHSMRPVIDKLREKGLEKSNEYAHLNDKSNMLRSALQGSSVELVDLQLEGIQLKESDCLILCSDGFEKIFSNPNDNSFFAEKNSTLSEYCLTMIEELEKIQDPKQDNATLIAIDANRYLF